MWGAPQAPRATAREPYIRPSGGVAAKLVVDRVRVRQVSVLLNSFLVKCACVVCVRGGWRARVNPPKGASRDGEPYQTLLAGVDRKVVVNRLRVRQASVLLNLFL